MNILNLEPLLLTTDDFIFIEDWWILNDTGMKMLIVQGGGARRVTENTPDSFAAANYAHNYQIQLFCST